MYSLNVKGVDDVGVGCFVNVASGKCHVTGAKDGPHHLQRQPSCLSSFRPTSIPTAVPITPDASGFSLCGPS